MPTIDTVGRPLAGSKICGEVVFGFSNAKPSSKYANELSASMLKILIAVILSVIFKSVQVAGGIKANSLAILTNVVHMVFSKLG